MFSLLLIHLIPLVSISGEASPASKQTGRGDDGQGRRTSKSQGEAASCRK